jgi:hypothetical protein
MVEHVQNFPVNHRANHVEVLDHAARRAAFLQRAPKRDLQPVRMPVGPGALAQVVRENVRCLEPEEFTNLHQMRFLCKEYREPSH